MDWTGVRTWASQINSGFFPNLNQEFFSAKYPGLTPSPGHAGWELGQSGINNLAAVTSGCLTV